MERRVWGAGGVVVLAVATAIGVAAMAPAGDAPLVLRPHDPSLDDPVLNGSDLSPPGTDLAGGFEVPRGTRLVGAVLPADPGRGRLAHLVAAGDPVEAFDRLVDQGRALGFPLSRSGAACLAEVSFPERPEEGWATAPLLELDDPSYRLHEGARGRHEVEAVACATSARGSSGRYAAVSAHGSPFASHVTLQLGPVPDHPLDPYAEGRDELVEVAHRRLTMPDAVELPTFRRAPEVGGRFGPTDGARFEVVAGSAVVAAWTNRTGTGHLAAVLRVDGDPEAVFRQYWEQLDPGARFAIATERTNEGLVVRSGVDEAGGWKIDMTMAVGAEGEPVWLHVEGHND